MAVDAEATAIAGSFFGVLARTVLAYWKARREARQIDPNLPFEFDREFLGTAVFAAAGAGATAVLAFPLLMADLPLSGSALGVFGYGFSFGWFANDAINMLVSVGQNTVRISKDRMAEVREFLRSKDKDKGVSSG
jgi:hypothetical protein